MSRVFISARTGATITTIIANGNSQLLRMTAAPPQEDQRLKSLPIDIKRNAATAKRVAPRTAAIIRDMPDVTSILNAIERGDRAAAAQLWPLVYDELRQLAGQLMARERPGQTLDATALVHEAYLRLAGAGGDG